MSKEGMSSQDHGEENLGLLVAKVKGFSWWPARETDPSLRGMKSRKGGVFVYFFGSRLYGWANKEHCLPFYENFQSIGGRRPGKLGEALAEARLWVQSEEELQRFDAIAATLVPAGEGGLSQVEALAALACSRERSSEESCSQTSGDTVAARKHGLGIDGGEDGGGARKSRRVEGEGTPSASSEEGGPSREEPATSVASIAGKADGSREEEEEEEECAQGAALLVAALSQPHQHLPPSRTPAPAQARWIGDPIKTWPDGRVEYASFAKHGQTFARYDCALLRAGKAGLEPYVMVIEAMWQTALGQMLLQGFWLYRPADLPPILGLPPRALLLSDWSDSNPLEAVLRRADITFSEEEEEEEAQEAKHKSGAEKRGGAGDGVCGRVFLSLRGAVRPLSQVLTDGKALLQEGGDAKAEGKGRGVGRVLSGAQDGRELCLFVARLFAHRLRPPPPPPPPSLPPSPSLPPPPPSALPDVAASRRGKEEEEEEDGVVRGAEGWVPLESRLRGWDGLAKINSKNPLWKEKGALGHQGPVAAMALSVDGEVLVSVTRPGAVSVWSVGARERVRREVVDARQGHLLDEAHAIALTHNATRCVVGGTCRDRYRWDEAEGNNLEVGGYLKTFDLGSGQLLQRVACHRRGVQRLLAGWSRGPLCLSLAPDDLLVLWRFRRGAFHHGGDVVLEGAHSMALLYPHPDPPPPPAPSPSTPPPPSHVRWEAEALVVAAGRGVTLLGLDSLEPRAAFPDLFRHSSHALALVPRKGGERRSEEQRVGEEGGGGQGEEEGSYKLVACGLDTHEGPVCAKLFELRLSTPPSLRVLRVMPSDTSPDRPLLSPAPHPLSTHRLLSNGRVFILLLGGRMTVWSLETGRVVAVLSHVGAATPFLSLLLHPRRRLLLVGSANGSVDLFCQQPPPPASSRPHLPPSLPPPPRPHRP